MKKLHINPFFLIKISGFYLILSLMQITFAACTLVPSSNASFGTVTSFAMSSVQKTTSVTDAGLSCTGSLIGLLGPSYYTKATFSTINNNKLMFNGDSIPYTIYSDPSYNTPITPPVTIDYYSTIAANGKITLPLYFRTTSDNYNLSAGTYSDTVNVNWSWSICTLAIGSICALPSTGSGTVSVTLNLVITKDCLIDTPDINFGTAPLISAFSPVTQTITLTCTKNSSYSISLDNGTNSNGGQRRLSANNGYFINYEIYQGSSGTVRWGSTTGQTRSSSNADINPGPANGASTQGFYYRAVILSGQTSPIAGTYKDSILLNVSF